MNVVLYIQHQFKTHKNPKVRGLQVTSDLTSEFPLLASVGDRISAASRIDAKNPLKVKCFEPLFERDEVRL